jgi:heat shock protein HtpX
MGAFGLHTHIASNNTKSVLLLAGFPVLLLLLMYALFLLYAGLAGGGDPAYGEVAQPFVWAGAAMTRTWPFALVGAGAWFTVAWFSHQALIDLSTGARALTRQDDPRVWNLLENLCISRGVTVPALRIMETPALNAFASGLTEKQYAITVTRGLVESLDDAELEAVLAHELTHIRNRDVRLLVIAVIFVGIFSFVGEMMFRGLTNVRWSGGGSGRSDSRSSGGGGGALIAIVAALVIIALAYALAVVIRFALSRRREYLADAGAVELTKNPDAMISALRKISGRAATPGVPAEVREMFFENAHPMVGELFATHPPIEKRIAALVRYAGGVEGGSGTSGPWGARAS